MHLGQEGPEVILIFSLHPVSWHMILIGPITGEVNFDQLIKAVSARFSTEKLPVFPLYE